MILYLIPFLAVIIGYIIGNFFTPKGKKKVKLILAFSGSFLLSLTVMHLLPNLYYEELKSLVDTTHLHSHLGMYIMLGIILQIVLEYFSKGAEHGHVHGHEKMYHIPWTLFISLCIHAFLEGIPIQNDNHLALGIAIHHFPIAIILSIFLKNAQLSQRGIFIFMLFFALMTPIGTYFFQNTIIENNHLKNALIGIVIGILFHISSTIIFETSEGHKFNLAKLTAIVLGIIVATCM